LYTNFIDCLLHHFDVIDLYSSYTVPVCTPQNQHGQDHYLVPTLPELQQRKCFHCKSIAFPGRSDWKRCTAVCSVCGSISNCPGQTNPMQCTGTDPVATPGYI